MLIRVKECPGSAESIEYIAIPFAPVKETLAPSGGVKSRGPSTLAYKEERKKKRREKTEYESFIMG